MEPELFDLMPDTVTVEPPTGAFSDRGQPTYGAATVYRCRIEPADGEVITRGAGLEERRAKWRLYLGTTDAIDAASRVTLPSGYTPSQPPVLAVGRVPDESGSHHVVILV